MKILQNLVKINQRLIALGIFSVFLLFSACRKDPPEGSIQSPSMFVLEARSFFEDEILNTMPTKPGPEGIKTPLWEQAKMVKISNGEAVVVPIKYDWPQGLKVDGEKTMHDLEKSS